MSWKRYGTYKGTAALVNASQRVPIDLDNRVQTWSVRCRLRGRVNVSVATTDRLNGGLLSAALQFVLTENGSDTFGVGEMSMFRAITEINAASAVPATPLPAGALAPGDYFLDEIVEISFANRRQVSPRETAYIEANPLTRLQANFILKPSALAQISTGGTATLNDVTVDVYQIADPAEPGLPLFKPRYREIVQSVSGTNQNDIFRIDSSVRLAGMMIRAEAQVGSATVEVSDVISALRLIGDGGANVIGPAQEDFAALRFDQALEFGGNTQRAGYLFVNFARNGRLSDTIVPVRDYRNFRFEFADQLTAFAGATATRIRVGLIELTRPAPDNGYPVVVPPDQLPDWLQ